MVDFPKIIKDGDVELRKVDATFEFTRQVFDIVNSNREFFGRWLPWVEFIKSVEDEYPYVQKLAKTDNASYHIFYKNELVGNIGFVKMYESDKFAEIGYWLDRKSNGRGIMGRSVKMMEKLAFEHCGFNRAEIRVDTENIPSQNVAKRAGYTAEGIARQSSVLRGKPRDIIIFSKIKSEYEKGK